MSFAKITDKDTIIKILDSFWKKDKFYSGTFIPAINCRRGVIYNDREFKGGLIIEGARTTGKCTDVQANEISWSLTNGDSNYTRCIGSVKLSDIESIEVFEKYHHRDGDN